MQILLDDLKIKLGLVIFGRDMMIKLVNGIPEKRSVELVIRDAGGEEALKELFLKEQDEKIIDDLKKLNPVIAERFGQHSEPGLQALKELIQDLGITNDMEGVVS
jgi:hypothetical protein